MFRADDAGGAVPAAHRPAGGGGRRSPPSAGCARRSPAARCARTGCATTTRWSTASSPPCWSRCWRTTSASCGSRWRAPPSPRRSWSASTATSSGLEAAWKYIIVTTIGISFGLFGTVLVYGAAVHAQGGVLAGAMNWSSIAAIAHQLDPGIVRIGFIFVLVGYGTKAGLAPVHMWLPDAHSQAPTPVSALLSGALIKCALFGIIRFHTIARGACGPAFSARPAAHLRPGLGGGGDALHHRPARPQAAARLPQRRARGDHRAGAGLRRPARDLRRAAARHQPRRDQGPGVPHRRRRHRPLRHPRHAP